MHGQHSHYPIVLAKSIWIEVRWPSILKALCKHSRHIRILEVNLRTSHSVGGSHNCGVALAAAIWVPVF